MSKTYDAVVISGGVVGAATAFHLKRLGRGRVPLIERDQTCSGGTAKSRAIAPERFLAEFGDALARGAPAWDPYDPRASS